MSTSDNMMDALRALVLKTEGAGTEATAPTQAEPSNPAMHRPARDSKESKHEIVLDEEEEESGNALELPKVDRAWMEKITDDPCPLTFHQQCHALRLSVATSHWRTEGYKAPHMAVRLGRTELFWWLVNHDEDYTSPNHLGENVFHIAAAYGREDILRGIYERFGSTFSPYDKRINEKATSDTKWTALHYAAAHGHLNIVKYLVETVGLSVKDKDRDMFTPLMLAATRGHFAVFKYLAHKRPLSALTEAGQFKYTALLLSAINGHTPIVKFIMKNGGSNMEITNLHNTALHIACMGGHCDIVQYLLDQHPDQFDVDTKNSNGQTALHLAAWAGHAPLARLLVTKYRASLTAKNAKGNTPFLMSCLRGYLDVAQTLVQLGAQFTDRNSNGNTPLLLAAYAGHNDIIRWLLDPNTNSGLTIHARSTSGNTALLHASAQALLHTVQVLVDEYGADLDDTNNAGRTAFTLASSYEPITKFLNSRKKVPVPTPTTTTDGDSNDSKTVNANNTDKSTTSTTTSTTTATSSNAEATTPTTVSNTDSTTASTADSTTVATTTTSIREDAPDANTLTDTTAASSQNNPPTTTPSTSNSETSTEPAAITGEVVPAMASLSTPSATSSTTPSQS